MWAGFVWLVYGISRRPLLEQQQNVGLLNKLGNYLSSSATIGSYVYWTVHHLDS